MKLKYPSLFAEVKPVGNGYYVVQKWKMLSSRTGHELVSTSKKMHYFAARDKADKINGTYCPRVEFVNKPNPSKIKPVIGYYNAGHYSVDLGDEEVYHAGNSPHDSAVYLSPKMGVGLAKMRKYCIQTAKDIAREQGAKYVGVERIEEDY